MEFSQRRALDEASSHAGPERLAKLEQDEETRGQAIATNPLRLVWSFGAQLRHFERHFPATGRSEKLAIMIRLDAAIADRLTQAAKRFGITRTALII